MNIWNPIILKGGSVPKPNYNFEKRKRELAKQRKKEEKRLRKQARKAEKKKEDSDDAES